MVVSQRVLSDGWRPPSWGRCLGRRGLTPAVCLTYSSCSVTMQLWCSDCSLERDKQTCSRNIYFESIFNLKDSGVRSYQWSLTHNSKTLSLWVNLTVTLQGPYSHFTVTLLFLHCQSAVTVQSPYCLSLSLSVSLSVSLCLSLSLSGVEGFISMLLF